MKTATYSLMHLSVAVTVSYVLTRDWHIALSIGLIEPIVQTIAYHFHEKLWGLRLKPVQVHQKAHGRSRETI